MKLNLYSVSDKYIKYLRQFDERIYDNKEDIRTQTRKYLGIVLTVNDFNYYIPMSSPKKSDYIDYEKKIIRKDTKTIIRIYNSDRLYGTLRISNMIPVPITELEPYVISNERNKKYKEVILGELRYINNNSEKIMKNAEIVYKQKLKNEEIGYIKNTVNYLRCDIFTKILNKDMKDFSLDNSGKYISILYNDIKIIEDSLLNNIFLVISSFISFIISLLFLFSISPSIVIFIVIFGILGFVIPNALSKKLIVEKNNYSHNLEEITSVTKDLFSGFEVIKGFNIGSKINTIFKNSSNTIKQLDSLSK